MPITDLPEELLLYISDYISEGGIFVGDPGSALASVNRSLSRSLLRKTRKIRIKINNEKWKSDEKRTKLLGMIDDPYRQLILSNQRYDDTFINTSMISEIGGFCWLHEFGSISGSEITTLVNSSLIKLKNLDLYDVSDLESFDVIPSLQSLLLANGYKLKIESLNLPAYPLLRSLTLSNCSSIQDVTCLDGIHDLKLYDCKNITDISPLNNNYRVTISYCDSITTYSSSFRSTCSLQIEEDRNVIVNLESCVQLTSLSLTNTMGVAETNIKYLRVLSVTDATNLTFLPPNRLQKVSIIDCHNFNSLDNITTLRGLGPKNQIITLVRMNKLEDISSLKESLFVKIYDCPLLHISNRLSCLTSVKELVLGRGLAFSASTFIDSFTQLYSLINLNVLELAIHVSQSQSLYESLRFHILQTFQNIEKIVFRDDYSNMINEEIRKVFHVIINRREGAKTILLRKRMEIA